MLGSYIGYYSDPMYGKCKVEGLGGAEGGRGQVDGSDSPAQQSKSLKATTEVAKHKYRL